MTKAKTKVTKVTKETEVTKETKVTQVTKETKGPRRLAIEKEIAEHNVKWKNIYNQKAKVDLTILHLALSSAIKANV